MTVIATRVHMQREDALSRGNWIAWEGSLQVDEDGNVYVVEEEGPAPKFGRPKNPTRTEFRRAELDGYTPQQRLDHEVIKKAEAGWAITLVGTDAVVPDPKEVIFEFNTEGSRLDLAQWIIRVLDSLNVCTHLWGDPADRQAILAGGKEVKVSTSVIVGGSVLRLQVNTRKMVLSGVAQEGSMADWLLTLMAAGLSRKPHLGTALATADLTTPVDPSARVSELGSVPSWVLEAAYTSGALVRPIDLSGSGWGRGKRKPVVF